MDFDFIGIGVLLVVLILQNPLAKAFVKFLELLGHCGDSIVEPKIKESRAPEANKPKLVPEPSLAERKAKLRQWINENN